MNEEIAKILVVFIAGMVGGAAISLIAVRNLLKNDSP